MRAGVAAQRTIRVASCSCWRIIRLGTITASARIAHGVTGERAARVATARHSTDAEPPATDDAEPPLSLLMVMAETPPDATDRDDDGHWSLPSRSPRPHCSDPVALSLGSLIGRATADARVVHGRGHGHMEQSLILHGSGCLGACGWLADRTAKGTNSERN